MVVDSLELFLWLFDHLEDAVTPRLQLFLLHAGLNGRQSLRRMYLDKRSSQVNHVTHTHTHARTHARTHACTHVHRSTAANACDGCTWTNIPHKSTMSHTHTHMHARTHVHTHVHRSTAANACDGCTLTNIPNRSNVSHTHTHALTHARTHTHAHRSMTANDRQRL